ncbi:hypothetical protein, partial [Yoonia sp.]|uniref:hypothetical protein n=1 Tax=Yoonia sp. TaxID=2212373 RepID=UPI003A4E3FAA
MLDKISAILVIEKHGGVDWRPPVVLHGTLPDTIDVALLQEASADKPALRKMGAGLAVILPQRAGAWVVWLLDVVPPVTALPDLVDRLTRLTRDLYGAGGSPVQAEKGITDLMLPRLAKSEKRDLASVAQMLADACVETGLARFALVADIRG